MGKNVAVFVDVANIFYAAKAAGADIDYVLLLKAATAGRDLVRAYAYTGLDPENENQRNFHSFLARHDFKVVSKDIRKYGDGKVKANLDIELVVDMMKTARNLDVAVVVSGDGDFAPAIRAVQEMGVRVEVISFRGNTSSDLMEVADKFTDITQLAKVERAGTASGRRVATEEDEDLSMTEVPDKESEGTGRGRGRGRGGRGRLGERPSLREPAARGRRGRDDDAELRTREPREPREAREPRETVAVREGVVARDGAPERDGERVAGRASLVALPGEKLSKAQPAAAAAVDEDEELVEEAVMEGADEAAAETGEMETDESGRRRRRRRGGRGRGRGRGRDGEAGEAGEPADEATSLVPDDEALIDDEEVLAPRPPRPAAFGSVWDSQIGVPAASAGSATADDEEYDDEPEIPEYLLTEQRRGRPGQGGPGGQRGGQRGGRGGRAGGAYAAAMERERYGRGGVSRFGEQSRPVQPARGGGGGGGGGGGQRREFARPAQQPRPERQDYRGGEPRSASAEPWSEVPPELEQMLRAQIAQKPRLEGRQATGTERPGAIDAPAGSAAEASAVAPAAGAAGPRRRTRRGASAAPAEGAGVVEAASEAAAAAPAEPGTPVGTAPAPAGRRRTPRTPGRAPAEAVQTEAVPAAVEVEAAPVAKPAASPRRRTRATPAAPAGAAPQAPAAAPAVEEPVAPRRRTRKAPAAQVEAPAPVDAPAAASDGAPGATADATAGSTADKPAVRRRTRKPAAAAEGG